MAKKQSVGKRIQTYRDKLDMSVYDLAQKSGIDEKVINAIEKGEVMPRFTEDDGETWTDLPGSTIVSMNLWGFNKSYLQEAEARFPAFLTETAKVNPMKGEFYLPTVVSQLLAEHKARVRVLESHDKWYGVTYKEDKPTVVEAMARMRKEGLYPEKLWEE